MRDSAHPQGAQSEARHVEIRVRGRLESRWTNWFEGLDITAHTDGTTVIHGPVVDQAALFGLLQRVQDIALPLISVIHVDPTTTDPTGPGTSPEPSDT
jgi:hypothetical protein